MSVFTWIRAGIVAVGAGSAITAVAVADPSFLTFNQSPAVEIAEIAAPAAATEPAERISTSTRTALEALESITVANGTTRRLRPRPLRLPDHHREQLQHPRHGPDPRLNHPSTSRPVRLRHRRRRLVLRLRQRHLVRPRRTASRPRRRTQRSVGLRSLELDTRPTPRLRQQRRRPPPAARRHRLRQPIQERQRPVQLDPLA